MSFHLVVIFLAVAADAPKDDVVKAEMAKLEGTWQLASAEMEGKKTPEETVKKIRVVIKDGKHTVHFGDQMVVKDVSFTVDPTKNPKQATDTLPDGRVIKSIYELDGNTLKSCVAEPGKDHPTEFASTPGSGYTLRIFKRVKQ